MSDSSVYLPRSIDMKFSFLLLYFSFLMLTASGQTSVVVSDVTISYHLSGKNIDNAKKIVYHKGRMVRTDLISSNYEQTLINNSRAIVMLKHVGTEKYLLNLSEKEWQQENECFLHSTIHFTGKTETILGFTCKNAIMRLKDGTEYDIYFTPEINSAVPQNSYEFGKIPGLILTYSVSDPKHQAITYVATSINFDIIPKSKFDIPTSGYRVLTDPELFQ